MAAWPEKAVPGQQGILAREEQVPRAKEGEDPPSEPQWIPTLGGC